MLETKYFIGAVIIGIILGGFLLKLMNKNSELNVKNTSLQDPKKSHKTFDEQLKIFNSLGYFFNEGVTKKDIFKEIYEYDDPEEQFIESQFSSLYYFFGWRNSVSNYSERCIWYDLEFIDPSTEYIWFMERMGDITQGVISYTNIELYIDSDKTEWIKFEVNGVKKEWKLAKVNFVADSFFQRFSYLPAELGVKGKYTYYDDGGQQFVIDFATSKEQTEFIKATGLKREWLGEGNHFAEPEN
jgi:hypothetical protein